MLPVYDNHNFIKVHFLKTELYLSDISYNIRK